jgi:hypothetical protein
MLRKTFIALATTIALSSGFAAHAVAQNGGFSGYIGGSAGGQNGGFAGDFRHPSHARVGDADRFPNRYRGHPGFDDGPPSCLLNDPDNLGSCGY